MGIFDKIKEVDLITELCEHLRQIGIEATVLDVKSPEAIHHTPTMHIIYSIKNIPPLGCVKVEGRNIDLVEVCRFLGSAGGLSGSASAGGFGGSAGPGGPLATYRYNYILKANVGKLEDKLKAEAERITKGLLGREIIDYMWLGGELAQLLNADTELKNMLLGFGSPKLMVHPNKKLQYVEITPIVSSTNIVIGGIPIKYNLTVGRKAFPTREAFEAYDRIAQHIRSILSSQP
ncbi:MAG: hypothetical protein ABSD73_10070 [Candidatus Bathyarchaeia archaeon]|jgi:hypothetical protein